MHAFKNLICLLFFLALITSCTSSTKEENTEEGTQLIKYSEKLSIQVYDNYTAIEVKHGKSTDDTFTYILYPKDSQKPNIKADAYITTPIENIICFSTSHLPAITALGQAPQLIGFPDTQWIYDSSLQTLVKDGSIADIGQKNGVNIEKTLTLNPGLVMAYSKGSAFEQLKPLQQADIPVVVNLDYMETNPLGRAEWIKFTAAFFQKLDQADSIFQEIELNYQKLTTKTAGIQNKPTVMTGVMYGDTWYVPGGKSYAAAFIEDAGGKYLWSENNESGSLELSYESVLKKAEDADYWLGAANFKSYAELKDTDSRYSYFKAFREQKIYGYTKRVSESGANDFLESGFLRPDLILQDYINILHPEVLNDSSTYFQPLSH